MEQFQVPYELFQYGFGKIGSINSTFAQDGSYSALLFDGEYKLDIPNGQGPFQWIQLPSGSPDSIAISMKGSKTLDLEVIPYYMIRTPQFSAAAGKVTGTIKIEKVITDATGKNIDAVRIYLNKTQFVSGGDFNISQSEISGASITDLNKVSLTVNIPSISPTQNYIFARIGIKISGVEDMIFSPVQKLSF